MAVEEELYGWVVVAAAFLIHVICDGITYSFGIVLAEFLDEFHEGSSLTSWTISILVGTTLASGPIATALANHFGCKNITILGSLIAAGGCLASTFATQLSVLIFTIGCVVGFGFGLTFCPAVIVVNMYFTRRRALAVGIVVCGAGVGTLIFAPFCAYLVEEYSWRGTFLIYAGIVLNGCVLGLLFRPPRTTQPPTLVAITDSDEIAHKAVETDKADMQFLAKSEEGLSKYPDNLVNSSIELSDQGPTRPRCFSLLNDAELRRFRTANKRMSEVLPTRLVRPLDRKDIFYSGSVLNIRNVRPLEEGQIDDEEQPSTNGNIKATTLISHKFSHRMRDFGTDMKEALLQLTDFSLFKEPTFVLMAISNFLTNLGYDLPLVFLPDHARRFDIGPERASWLLSAWGISNTVGRVLVGIIADQPWAVNKRLHIYNASLMLCGIVNAISVCCTDYPSLMIYASLFGLTLSTYISLTSVVIVDLLGLERLTNAFGLLLFFQGIGAVVGPPIGGVLVDATGNYADTYFFAAICLFISGAMLCPIPCIVRCTKRSSDAAT